MPAELRAERYCSEVAPTKKILDGVLDSALEAAGKPKPLTITASGGDNRQAKKNWAQRFSNGLAIIVADALRPRYKDARVTPYEDGLGQEFSVGGKVDRKRTDVGVWDDAAGLVAGVSIKTYTFRDTHQKSDQPRYEGRYVRNVKRNDMELRDEADVLHRRQPYAVLTALFFMNEDACWDAGSVNGQSSFAAAVFTLRKRTGRSGPDARFDLFEMVFVGLVDEKRASVRFFDVRKQPRQNQPPDLSDTISLNEVVVLIDKAVIFRNTGVNPDERYAAVDIHWTIPVGSLPLGLDKEVPITLRDVIESAGLPEETYVDVFDGD